MLAGPTAFPILRTKLHRPPVATDLVAREELMERLEAGRRLPLTLVSAPAGYGKTTLVSHWLETCQVPTAWVSFDETDSDVTAFLHYVVTAVRTLFPEACEDLLSRLSSSELPPLPHLAGFLCNDLDVIEEPFVLAFDDYHRIREPAVHELMDQVLKHPPQGLHLVISCRHDPPLSLVSLRGQHRMTEVRMRDLRFTRDESATFLGFSIGRTLDDEALESLQSSTEGWPVALRLSAVALRHSEDRIAELAQGLSDSREVQRYLVAEVLERQSPTVRDWLCKTSVLDRFCASLCEAVCASPEGPDREDLDGRTFLRALEERGLLSVALDERREWFRYHHLFQESLRRNLTESLGAKEIVELHRRAAKWLEGQDLIEEALHHLLTADDSVAAGQLIVRLRLDIIQQEQWHRLGRWLDLLPQSLVEEDPELLLLVAWSADHRGDRSTTLRTLEAVESRLASVPNQDGKTRQWRGEIAALRGRDLFVFSQDGDVRHQAEEALRLLPPEFRGERGYAKMVLAAAFQREGALPQARAMLYETLEGDARHTPTYRGRVLLTLTALHWMDSDLEGLEPTAAAMQELGAEHGLRDTGSIARFFRGLAKYHRNGLGEAQDLLTVVTTDQTAAPFKFHVAATYFLALIHQARGRPARAKELLESAATRFLEGSSIAALPIIEAARAELALRQGRLAEAIRWAEGFEARELPKGTEFFWLELTAVRTFLEQGTPASLARAEELLDSQRRILESLHYRRFLLDIEALQALLHDRRDERDEALATLKRAVARAQPGRWIRVFVDLGPRLANLFRRLDVDGDTRRYVDEILAAFETEGRKDPRSDASVPSLPAIAAGEQPLIEPLTDRELEILAGLSERLSNKEIAARLGISSATVKRHVSNVYQKLAVHGRREAAAKALELGLLAVD